VGVDNENAKYRINQLCLERRLTAIYAGVYERGEGGDAVIISPYNGPCYACWAEELRSGAALVDDPQELDYGMIGETGTLEAEPGLWLHVARIASAQTDIGLNALLEGTAVYRTMPGNTVIMANSAIEIVPGEITLPYAAEWFAIERNPNCMVCGHFYEDSAVSLADLLATNGLGIDTDTDDEER
jgi:molybdopterin/thiamine biosynthesis adenylyltransferase